MMLYLECPPLLSCEGIRAEPETSSAAAAAAGVINKSGEGFKGPPVGRPVSGLKGRHISGLTRLQEWHRTGSTGSEKESAGGAVGLLLRGMLGGGPAGTPLPPRFDRRSLEKRGDQTGQDGNLHKIKEQKTCRRDKTNQKALQTQIASKTK